MEREPKDQRVPIMVTATELKAIDDWRFENRVATRADAIRQLIAGGLQHYAAPAAPTTAKRSKSSAAP